MYIHKIWSTYVKQQRNKYVKRSTYGLSILVDKPPIYESKQEPEVN